MACPRCGGLIVRETSEDFGLGSLSRRRESCPGRVLPRIRRPLRRRCSNFEYRRVGERVDESLEEAAVIHKARPMRSSELQSSLG